MSRIRNLHGPFKWGGGVRSVATAAGVRCHSVVVHKAEAIGLPISKKVVEIAKASSIVSSALARQHHDMSSDARRQLLPNAMLLRKNGLQPERNSGGPHLHP